MTSFPNSPQLLKGGIVLIDPGTRAVSRIIVLQYNADTLNRTLQVKGVGESGDRWEAVRIKGQQEEILKRNYCKTIDPETVPITIFAGAEQFGRLSVQGRDWMDSKHIIITAPPGRSYAKE